jgi:hypothetical protein
LKLLLAAHQHRDGLAVHEEIAGEGRDEEDLVVVMQVV